MIGDADIGPRPAATLRERFVNPRVLDRIEQVGIILLWTWLCFRVVESDNGHAWLAMVSETTILIFVLIRRSTDSISLRVDDWMLALSATFIPGFVVVTGEPVPGFAWLATILVLAGEIFEVWAKLTLARSFGIAPANRGVKSHGPYALVRHPIYAGYCVSQAGVLLVLPSTINFCLIGGAWTLQILRIRREEHLLSRDPAYRAMMEKVRWRLLPGVW